MTVRNNSTKPIEVTLCETQFQEGLKVIDADLLSRARIIHTRLFKVCSLLLSEFLILDNTENAYEDKTPQQQLLLQYFSWRGKLKRFLRRLFSFRLIEERVEIISLEQLDAILPTEARTELGTIILEQLKRRRREIEKIERFIGAEESSRIQQKSSFERFFC